MNRIPFSSISVFLFVFTFICNGHKPISEEVRQLRFRCWNIIQFYFDNNGNDSNAQARYAWDYYTLAIVEQMRMPLDAQDFYKSFKNYLFVDTGYETTSKYCDKQNQNGYKLNGFNEKSRCNDDMRTIFGGSPKFHTELVMYNKTKAMLSLVDKKGQKVFGDYMIPYWNTIRNLLFVTDNFPKAQEFCAGRYKQVEQVVPLEEVETEEPVKLVEPVEPVKPGEIEEPMELMESVESVEQVEPVLLNLFPTSPDLGKKV